jgi:uncharacterized protein YbbK (DUF523 family)
VQGIARRKSINAAVTRNSSAIEHCPEHAAPGISVPRLAKHAFFSPRH